MIFAGADVSHKGFAFLERRMETASESGGDFLTGALYAPFGMRSADRGRTTEQRKRGVGSLRELCEYALSAGFTTPWE